MKKATKRKERRKKRRGKRQKLELASRKFNGGAPQLAIGVGGKDENPTIYNLMMPAEKGGPRGVEVKRVCAECDR